MEQIKRIILDTVREAVFDEKGKTTIRVAPDQLHPLLLDLRNNKTLPLDYLVYLIGSDEGEMLQVTYLLSSSLNPSVEIIVKQALPTGKNLFYIQ